MSHMSASCWDVIQKSTLVAMLTQNSQFNFTHLNVESILVLEAVKWGEKRENRRFSRRMSGASVVQVPHSGVLEGVKYGAIHALGSG